MGDVGDVQSDKVMQICQRLTYICKERLQGKEILNLKNNIKI